MGDLLNCVGCGGGGQTGGCARWSGRLLLGGDDFSWARGERIEYGHFQYF